MCLIPTLIHINYFKTDSLSYDIQHSLNGCPIYILHKYIFIDSSCIVYDLAKIEEMKCTSDEKEGRVLHADIDPIPPVPSGGFQHHLTMWNPWVQPIMLMEMVT